MGDTLDDEWWVTNDASDGEGSSGEAPEKKLKKELSEGSSPEEGSDSETTAKPEVPKKKKRKRRKITDELKKDQKEKLPNDELLKVVKKHFEGKLSTIEADEVDFEENKMAVRAELDDTPTSYLKLLLPKWKKLKGAIGESPGSPLLLMITSSAIRATELIRQIADFRGEKCKVAKLFAKHMKIEDQNKFLQKTVIHIGVGTPNRIKALLDAETLKLTQAKFIVFDWSWRDAKFKRLIEVKDIKADLMKLLQNNLIPCVKQSKTKLALL